jgi:hypothetical protein
VRHNSQACFFGYPTDNAATRFGVERAKDSITMWFWPKESPTVPSDVRDGAECIDTDNWVCLLDLDCLLRSLISQ